VRLGALPVANAHPPQVTSPEEKAIRAQTVCVGSSVESAGDLGDTLYYRAVRAPNGQIVVGYFAFWSEERPWGNNWMTWTFVPALVVDMVYSRALLVAPGLQRALSGKGDVEGVRIYYGVNKDGSLSADRAAADDGTHQDVQLSHADLFALDPAHPTVYSDVWSHQLGGKDAHARGDLAYERCFSGDAIRPLPDDVARDFHADGYGRARPAHVEAMGEPVSPGEWADPAAAAGRVARSGDRDPVDPDDVERTILTR
jgi:hypothetical protein